MRYFEPPEKVDILVSELLGSFGDNELSPECLDGAQKHLKPDGISIPCQSTSYLNPVMAPKILRFLQNILYAFILYFYYWTNICVPRIPFSFSV